MLTNQASTSEGRHRHSEAVVALCKVVEVQRRRAAEQLGISETGLAALVLICAGDGISPSDIATELDLTSGSVSPMLDQLAGSGYIERSPHPRDRRRLLINAKPGGHHALAWATEQMDQYLRDVTANMSEQDHDAVARFLSAATEALDR
ncbi:MAG: MarR family transcriptional regulator [Brachybacterium sp.]|uniref:MarR family winged helix-turn-helix transcriptional regulator n=1 Tax=Brachybacterium sp. TaxID=1891286 RepID=UPI002647DF39|nr:MarR family transcriptional regulator [Brachybacterium sp.]MDN5685927.1 MarR family transcriptional regulator [Brachybacterium sp.]